MEYTSAYEKEAQITKAVREVLFSKDEVIINEELQFEGESAIFRYYMRECPVKKNGYYEFECGVKMYMPFDVEITPISLDDQLVINGWNTECLYCMNFSVSPEKSKFTIKINKNH